MKSEWIIYAMLTTKIHEDVSRKEMNFHGSISDMQNVLYKSEMLQITLSSLGKGNKKV